MKTYVAFGLLVALTLATLVAWLQPARGLHPVFASPPPCPGTGPFQPVYVGTGNANFTRNQDLPCLPLVSGTLPVGFIIQAVEPSIRTDEQGTIYVSSIR